MPERNIDTALWDHPDFEKLSAHGRLLFVYLCTTPKGNQAGMYRISVKSISEHTGIPKGKISQLFNTLSIMDVVYYPDKELVWVKNFLRRQSHSPKFMVAVAKCLEKMSDKEMVSQFLTYNEDLSIPYRYPIDTLSIPEPEPEPEPEPDISSSKEDSSDESDNHSVRPSDVVSLFHECCPSLPRVQVLTETRRKAIQARARQSGHTLDAFRNVFELAEGSDFLSGRSGSWAGCGFDWLMSPQNWVKVVEGNYDNGRRKPEAHPHDRRPQKYTDPEDIYVD